MLQGLVDFHVGLWRSPPRIQIWLVALSGANMAAVFFLPRIEAVATLIVLGLSLLLMGALTARYGFTRLLGAGHVLWLALIPWLIPRALAADPATPFGIWLWAVIVANLVSLVLDAFDVARYLGGERRATVRITR